MQKSWRTGKNKSGDKGKNIRVNRKDIIGIRINKFPLNRGVIIEIKIL